MILKILYVYGLAFSCSQYQEQIAWNRMQMHFSGIKSNQLRTMLSTNSISKPNLKSYSCSILLIQSGAPYAFVASFLLIQFELGWTERSNSNSNAQTIELNPLFHWENKYTASKWISSLKRQNNCVNNSGIRHFGMFEYSHTTQTLAAALLMHGHWMCCKDDKRPSNYCVE